MLARLGGFPPMFLSIISRTSLFLVRYSSYPESLYGLRSCSVFYLE